MTLPLTLEFEQPAAEQPTMVLLGDCNRVIFDCDKAGLQAHQQASTAKRWLRLRFFEPETASRQRIPESLGPLRVTYLGGCVTFRPADAVAVQHGISQWEPQQVQNVESEVITWPRGFQFHQMFTPDAGFSTSWGGAYNAFALIKLGTASHQWFEDWANREAGDPTQLYLGSAKFLRRYASRLGHFLRKITPESSTPQGATSNRSLMFRTLLNAQPLLIGFAGSQLRIFCESPTFRHRFDVAIVRIEATSSDSLSSSGVSASAPRYAFFGSDALLRLGA